jgi:hypothetical protein
VACGGGQNAYAAAAVAEEDAERREHDGEDDLEARRATAGIAHPVVRPSSSSEGWSAAGSCQRAGLVGFEGARGFGQPGWGRLCTRGPRGIMPNPAAAREKMPMAV